MARDEDPLWTGLGRPGDLWAGFGRPGDRLVADSAKARSRRRWLAQLAAESATLAGILLTLAEYEEPVTLHCGPWAHQGLLRRVGVDTCVIETNESVVLVANATISWVDSSRVVADDRTPAEGPDLATALAELSARHPAVTVQLRDGSELAGALATVGKDAAQLRLPSSNATVRLSAIACAVLPLAGRAR